MRNVRADQRRQPGGFDHDGGAGVLAVVARRPIDALACGLAAACVAMILYNALALQEGRRGAPAPAAQADRQKAATVAAPAAVPSKPQGWTTAAPARDELVAQVQSALSAVGAYDGPQDGVMGAQTAAAIRAFEKSQKMEQTGEASERILAAAMLLPRKKAEAAPAAKTAAPATTGSTAPSPKLMAVQKVLAKYGYSPGVADGRMGTDTRAAIMTFERDHKLPETGELSPATLKAITAVTGQTL